MKNDEIPTCIFHTQKVYGKKDKQLIAKKIGKKMSRYITYINNDGLVQDCSISFAAALEML